MFMGKIATPTVDFRISTKYGFGGQKSHRL